MIRRDQFFILLFMTIGLGLFNGCQKRIRKADLILENGYFFTVNSEQPFVEAVAIRGSRILAVGANSEMIRFIGPKTERIDLHGKFGCPGFNDAHFNLLKGGKSRIQVDLFGVRSIRDIQRRILKNIYNLRPGSWLIGWGWDQTLLPDGLWPTRRILDVISPDVPIFLNRICGHVALVNRKALDIAGITADTPDPPGGIIEKNPITGKPTGILKGEAIKLVEQYIPPLTEEELISMVRYILKHVKEMGITTIQDFGSREIHSVYEQLLNQEELTCRISLNYPLQEDLSLYSRLREKYRSPFLYFGLVYGVVDGAVGSETALFFQPYSDNALNFGISRMTQNELNILVLQADLDGFQMGIEAVGDRGNRMVLDSYELAQKVNGKRDSRHRIEHAQVLTGEDFSRFNQLDIIASMQPAYCIEEIDWIEDRIGRERCRYAFAWNSLKSNGVRLAFGSDWPLASMNPLVGLYTAITRRDSLGYPRRGWFPRERVTIEEAIEAYTLGSAYAEFMETKKGSIEPGKLADIVIFNRNLLHISPKLILNAHVVYTILNGEIVFHYEE